MSRFKIPFDLDAGNGEFSSRLQVSIAKDELDIAGQSLELMKRELGVSGQNKDLGKVLISSLKHIQDVIVSLSKQIVKNGYTGNAIFSAYREYEDEKLRAQIGQAISGPSLYFDNKSDLDSFIRQSVESQSSSIDFPLHQSTYHLDAKEANKKDVEKSDDFQSLVIDGVDVEYALMQMAGENPVQRRSQVLSNEDFLMNSQKDIFNEDLDNSAVRPASLIKPPSF